MRSLLFAPASHARHSVKVFECGADAAILDLEDAVAISDKPAARSKAVAALATPRGCRAYVRVNAFETEFALGDFLEVVRPGLDGIILPKAQSAEDVAQADWLLTQVEREHGMAPGGIELIPIVETARGVMNAGEIARRSRRVRRLAFGAGDYVNDLGSEWTAGEEELLLARQTIVNASRAADLAPPIDTAHVDIADMASLERAARRARSYGFGGKFCIYPAQVAVVNGVFTPSDAEVARARHILSAFEEAERQGLAAIRVDGALVDYPIAFRAAQVVRSFETARGATTS
jgi:citrate lyase subunit beta/citryl-CoA lyase